MQLWIGLQAGAKRLQIRETQLLRNGQFFCLVALDLVETDLVNLVRSEFRGRAAPDDELVVPDAVGNRGDARLGAPRRNVGDFEEMRQTLVSGQYLFPD